MFSKKLAYILIGIIALLSVVLGANLFSDFDSDKNNFNRINNVLSKFEEKFKQDSMYLANSYKLKIDEISQNLIDSISTVYEKKLSKVVMENKKYKKILRANNININPINKKENQKRKSKNIASYNDIANSKHTNNVTSYSKLTHNSLQQDNTITETKYTNNTTPYNKLKQPNQVITNSEKVRSSSQSNAQKENINTFNPTSHTKLQKTEKLKSNNISVRKPNKLIHNNYLLDSAVNMNNIDSAPVFFGCENKLSPKEKMNCFASKLSRYIFDHFNSSNLKNSGLKDGIHKVRVLFIIDEKGNTKFGKIVGKWPIEIYEEVKKTIESTPKMKPAILNNKIVSVKYSLLIPFLIN